MVNYFSCRSLESKRLEPKSLIGFLPLQLLTVFSLQSKNLLRPSRTLNRARGPIRRGGEEADPAQRRGLNIDHFTGGEDGCVAVAVGVHRGEAAGVEVIDHLLTGDPVARCAERLLEGHRRGPITGMQRGNREESEE